MIDTSSTAVCSRAFVRVNYKEGVIKTPPTPPTSPFWRLIFKPFLCHDWSTLRRTRGRETHFRHFLEQHFVFSICLRKCISFAMLSARTRRQLRRCCRRCRCRRCRVARNVSIRQRADRCVCVARLRDYVVTNIRTNALTHTCTAIMLSWGIYLYAVRPTFDANACLRASNTSSKHTHTATYTSKRTQYNI